MLWVIVNGPPPGETAGEQLWETYSTRNRLTTAAEQQRRWLKSLALLQTLTAGYSNRPLTVLSLAPHSDSPFSIQPV